MTIIHPTSDTAHIVKKAMNCKTLTTLSHEEDKYQAQKKQNKTPIQSSVPNKKFPLLCSKDDLQEFKLKTKNKNQDEIFELLGINVSYNDDGTKNISHYGWPWQAYSFKAAGIDEEELLKGVKSIHGDCDLTGSNLKNLGDVKNIYGNLTIPLYGKTEDLSSIEFIGRNILCSSESQEDVIKLIKKLKLNPKVIHGYINPHEVYRYYIEQYICTKLPGNMDEAVKILQNAANSNKSGV